MNKTIDGFEEEQAEKISVPSPEVSLAERPKRKRRFGDRYDGYRVKKLDTQFWIVPNIMRTRTDSQVMFNEVVGIGELDRYIHRKRDGRHSQSPHGSCCHCRRFKAVCRTPEA